MVVNMNMHSEEEGNINDYLSDTIASVFDYVCTADVRGTTNRELFATQDVEVFASFGENAAKLEDARLAVMMGRVGDALTVYEKGEYLLTDDKAPVELLGMSVIDGLIQKEIGYYKEIFREEGMEGLLNALLAYQEPVFMPRGA